MNRQLCRREVLGMLGGGASLQAARRASSKRNVLFIAIDDLNDWTGDLGGYPGVRTPNIDRLARRGVSFTKAYCASPVCHPSRTAVLTGLRPSTTGIYENSQWWRPALPGAVSIPEHFKNNGYTAAGRGKIYHHTLGFDEPSAWHEFHEQLPDPYPAGRPLSGIKGATPQFDYGPAGVTTVEMADSKVADWTAEFLGRTHDRPFFAAAGLFKPHLTWYVPAEYFERYPLDGVRVPEAPVDDLDDVPAAGRALTGGRGDLGLLRKHKALAKAVQAYLACITFMDEQVGRIIAALDQSRYAENTIVVLWSDHGWHFGEKQHLHKSTLWERATRVPLIIAGPGTARGKRCGRTVNLIDLYPTLNDLCGLPAVERLEGISLGPLLRNPDLHWGRPSLTTFGRGNHAVRSERWRYIRYKDGSEELYDHDKDPNEWTNLAGTAGSDKVKQALRVWLPKTDAAEAPGRGSYPREIQERMMRQSKQRIDVHTGKPYRNAGPAADTTTRKGR